MPWTHQLSCCAAVLKRRYPSLTLYSKCFLRTRAGYFKGFYFISSELLGCIDESRTLQFVWTRRSKIEWVIRTICCRWVQLPTLFEHVNILSCFYLIVVGIEQTVQKFLDVAKQLECLFLQKRMQLSIIKPEQFIKEVTYFYQIESRWILYHVFLTNCFSPGCHWTKAGID